MLPVDRAPAQKAAEWFGIPYVLMVFSTFDFGPGFRIGLWVSALLTAVLMMLFLLPRLRALPLWRKTALGVALFVIGTLALVKPIHAALNPPQLFHVAGVYVYFQKVNVLNDLLKIYVSVTNDSDDTVSIDLKGTGSNFSAKVPASSVIPQFRSHLADAPVMGVRDHQLAGHATTQIELTPLTVSATTAAQLLHGSLYLYLGAVLFVHREGYTTDIPFCMIYEGPDEAPEDCTQQLKS